MEMGTEMESAVDGMEGETETTTMGTKLGTTTTAAATIPIRLQETIVPSVQSALFAPMTPLIVGSWKRTRTTGQMVGSVFCDWHWGHVQFAKSRGCVG
mmetsp:Transcript_932/g.1335  ORF Transcript_932/g.1335 Transcript_932/m.1335 type:complete len:98 (+) Transcript_932:81-374(+)